MSSMQTITLIAATGKDLGHSHSVMDALPHLGGMLMVLVTLVILWGLTAALSRMVSVITSRQSAPPAAVTKRQTPVPSAAPAAEDGTNPQIVAVIAAAVASMTGGTRRVISIKPIDKSWEKAGRQSVLRSHRIR